MVQLRVGRLLDENQMRVRLESGNSRVRVRTIVSESSQTSNIAFLTDSAETVDLDFGLIHQNISFKKASFHY